MRLHFQRSGQGDPLLILHGLLGGLANWRSVSAALAAHFQVVAVDLRNHGASPHSDQMTYPLMAEDVAELVRGESLGPAIVLGHSMGGKTAMELALGLPELVRKLVVVDISPKAYPPWHRGMLDALVELDLTLFNNRSQVVQALAPSVPEAAVRQFLVKNLARDANGRLHWQINLPGIAAAYDHLNQALTPDRQFPKPALFLRGAKSDYLPHADRAPILRLFPAAQFVTIPGAGHWVHADAPGPFIEALLRFLTNSTAAA
jgi:esterase